MITLLVSRARRARRLGIEMPRRGYSLARGTLAAAAVAAAAAPQGFLVSQLRGAAATGPSQPSRFWAVVTGGLKKIALACLWASMIAAGQLIYLHFVEKWTARGYPALPISALRPGDGRPGGNVISLGPGSAPANGASAPSGATGPRATVILSGFEEYKD